TLVHEFVELIENNKSINTKEGMIKTVCSNFAMVKDGKAVYHTNFFAVVFCYSKNSSFSNVVLSLSKLEKYDRIPCFVVLVKKDLDNVIYLINTTFLNKISHSSKDLRTDNIRGSLTGGNIRKNLEEIDKCNKPEDFEDLFAYHQGFTWQENIERLVESTNNIKPDKAKAVLGEAEIDNLFNAPSRAVEFVGSEEYNVLLQDLRKRCDDVKDAILVAAHIDNVNIRGRLIEVLITSGQEERNKLLKNLRDIEQLLPTYDTKNELGDYIRNFENSESYTDIKTKVLYLDSNPKAYNIDKFLKCMGKEKSVFMFFFVGIDDTGIVNTILASVFHNKLQDTTFLQHHWAGRGTRGAAQFNGKTINEMLQEDPFINKIDIDKSKQFLKNLLDR
ncbi:MAG: hypothetical protein IKW61_03040, partial [Bacteroidaceae bacterium]|nr:hypothetical protein [Bacteroidaceae bacterium]